MASLYGHLSRFPRSELRNPFENFLSEALADLLNRFSPEMMADFLRLVFAAPSLGGEMLSELIRAATDDGATDEKAVWETQRTIFVNDSTPRYTDLVLMRGETPLVVIENKIQAGFTDGQLTAYGQWLDLQGGKPCGLALLTHMTIAPDDFLSPSSRAYGNGMRAVCQWASLYRWLRNRIRYTPSLGEWSFLAREFVRFMEESMSVKEPTITDLAVAQMSMKPLQTIKNLVDSVRQFNGLADAGFASGGQSKKLDFENQIVHDYSKYIRQPETGWWAGWGIGFQTDVERIWYGMRLDFQEPTAFMVIASENQPIPLERLNSLAGANGWNVFKKYAMKRVPVTQMLSQKSLAEQYLIWTRNAIKQAGDILLAGER